MTKDSKASDNTEKITKNQTTAKKKTVKKTTSKKSTAKSNKTLIIVESPTKIKSISQYLGKDYDVEASMGHIRDLPAARLNIDVKNDFEPKYGIIKGKEKLVKALKEKAQKADKVLLATDPDREGEAISYHLAYLLGLDLKEKNRVSFNEITKTGVEYGINHPTKIDMDLFEAQKTRRILDRLFGYRLSPFVSQKIRRGLSAGRVQSVAVRLIVDRENEIRAFKPEEYWTIEADFNVPSKKETFTASLVKDEKGKVEIKNKAENDEYIAFLEKANHKIESVKYGTRKRTPAPPFNTSTLQQAASNKLGFRTRRTMQTAQELYEGINLGEKGTVGLITYMRTDSLRISKEARQEATKFIESKYGKEYLPEKPRHYRSRKNTQDAHEAIRPTDPSLSAEEIKGYLSSDQYKLYKLIRARFLMSLMADCIQNTIKIVIKSRTDEKSKFCELNASGSNVKFDGFTVLSFSTEKEEKQLPNLEKEDEISLDKLNGEQHFTQPPARYTEASLVKALEENGIGRPSTYASIISTIISREYIIREQKSLKPTELGEVVTKLLLDRFSSLVDYEFTAKMEDDLDEISEGKTESLAVISDFYKEMEEQLTVAKEEMKGVKIELKEDQTDIPCEKCGRMMVVKVGRYGKFLACPGYPECKNTKPLINETKATCPKCGGKVVQRKTKRGYVFYGCGNYPDCDFLTWDIPTEENCPNCQSSLFKTKGKKGKIHCLKEGCGYERENEDN
ncbi:MAG: type I DNA topoisomerase [Clostridia bacterium]|nr:type I DNA topoisomerase [Clostridia bacterium]